MYCISIPLLCVKRSAVTAKRHHLQSERMSINAIAFKLCQTTWITTNHVEMKKICQTEFSKYLFGFQIYRLNRAIVHLKIIKITNWHYFVRSTSNSTINRCFSRVELSVKIQFHHPLMSSIFVVQECTVFTKICLHLFCLYTEQVNCMQNAMIIIKHAKWIIKTL